MSRLGTVAAALVLIVLVALSVSAQDDNVHVVLPGENLFRISQDFGVSVDDIARANNIEFTWLIYAGQRLVIPDPNAIPASSSGDLGAAINTAINSVDTQTNLSASATAIPLAAPTEAPTEYYTVVYGQSLAQIAQAHGMTLSQLARLNNITNPDLIYAGQKLIVSGLPPADAVPTPFPTSVVPGATNLVTHIVQPGETLASIADRYGLSWLQIAQTNNIFDADQIRIGQELTIPGGSVLNDASYSFISAPAAPPPLLGYGKEIIVDLSDQRTYAYEEGRLVRNVLSSTGLPATPTVRGDFKIQRKYVAQTMTGPGYYLPDVPYVLYFYAGYALHGTYWHDNFGHQMSHGCVNLPTPEAGWFYNWAEVGTPVHVQY